MTGEIEVSLTEEFETMSTAAARGAPAADDTESILPAVLELSDAAELTDTDLPPPATRAQHGARERGHARELFARLDEPAARR